MLLLPFVRLQHSFQILTVGGTHLWQEEDTLRIEEDVMGPNGIILVAPPRVIGGLSLCEIDATQTNLQDFYEWNDLPLESDTICTRVLHDLPCVPPPTDAMIAPLPLGEILAALRAF